MDRILGARKPVRESFAIELIRRPVIQCSFTTTEGVDGNGAQRVRRLICTGTDAMRADSRVSVCFTSVKQESPITEKITGQGSKVKDAD